MIMLNTGFRNLDEILGGIKEGELITIASRPGMGKSTLIIDIINNIAKQTKDRILYFNLETSKKILQERITSDNVEIIDTPAITIEEIRSICEEASRNGLALVAIDYIELVTASSNENIFNKIIDYISRILKTVALELNIPIIVSSQLGRQLEEREDRRPRLRDLDIKGSLLQNADKVILLYKEYELDDVELTVAKNRSGSIGKAYLMLDKETCCFKVKHFD